MEDEVLRPLVRHWLTESCDRKGCVVCDVQLGAALRESVLAQLLSDEEDGFLVAAERAWGETAA